MAVASTCVHFQRCALRSSNHLLHRAETAYVKAFKQSTSRYHGLSLQLKSPKCTHKTVCRTFKARVRLTPGENNAVQDYGPTEWLRPFCFTAVVCTGSFTGAMIWQYESMRSYAKKIMNGTERKFAPQYAKQYGFRSQINSMWNSISPGKKMVATIVASNIAVFMLWKVPSLQRTMLRYFTCLPLRSRPTVSMLLSAFSHCSSWHLAVNMYVLWSFSSISVNMFGREQFLGVYFSAAVLSSFTSYINKIARNRMIFSLGASGAIMAILGAVCVSYPDSRLSIAFVSEIFPHSFTADSAMKFMIALDTLGVIMGWRVFDHAAHLGGILFGIWYVKYGQNLIWKKRDVVMKYWHEIRGKP